MRIIFLIILCLPSSAYSQSAALAHSLWANAAAYAGVDVNTLYGIALQETGMKWPDGTFRPWPWTLYVNKTQNGVKKGPYRYGTKRGAQQALLRMLALGATNIDVGLMQVNLLWNGKHVKDKASLLEPGVNLSVAAKILKGVTQVGQYHSFNPQRRDAYAVRVRRFQRLLHEKYD